MNKHIKWKTCSTLTSFILRPSQLFTDISLRQKLSFFRLVMWDHSYSSQSSGTMDPAQAEHSPPSLCSQPNFSNMAAVPSPPQHTSYSKLGGLLSKFKPHFDRIRNWRCNKRCSFPPPVLLWHTAGMSVWEWAAMVTSWQRLSLFAGQVYSLYWG